MQQRPIVIFIHGLWVHASAWQPWQDLFRDRGFESSAPGWPGEADTVAETRANSSGQENVGIQAICEHYAGIIDALPTKPVIVGHSFGGLIAQELLANGYAAAAVAIDPAPIKGVNILPFSQLRSGFPVLGNPANKSRTVSLTAKEFRYSFGNAITAEESDSLHDTWTIPGPGRPLFEDATANFSKHSPAAVDTHVADRGPLLLVSGTEDHIVPLSVTKAVVKLYAGGPSLTDFIEFEGRGHSLTMDSGWRDVAEGSLEWIEGQGFTGSLASASAEADPGSA
jgi:pimeloyl-ACP methyl ester carboxylesterase